ECSYRFSFGTFLLNFSSSCLSWPVVAVETTGHRVVETCERRGLTSCLGPVRPDGIGQVAGLIAIMVAEPGHRERQVVFIAAFGNEIEIVICVDRVLTPASVRGISVEDVAIFILVEDADPRGFRTGKFRELVVVFNLAFGQLLLE